jgi:hypothetical protein
MSAVSEQVVGSLSGGQAVNAARPAARSLALGSYLPRGITIRPEQMLRIMGYREGAAVRPAVRRMTAAMAELAASAIAPVVRDCQAAIARCDENGLLLSGGIAFRGPVFAKYLAGCDTAVAFILTLGGRFDSTEKNLVAGNNLLEAVLLNAAGWVAVEEATRLYAEALASRIKPHGLALTRRLAPGYSFRVGGEKVEWSLEDQKQLFGLFADAELPVRLLESCAMTPKMSRTGFYGLHHGPVADA